MSVEVLCPRCPQCSGPPDAFLASVTLPWFCPDETCSGLSWDPTKTLDENLLHTSFVDLPSPPE